MGIFDFLKKKKTDSPIPEPVTPAEPEKDADTPVDPAPVREPEPEKTVAEAAPTGTPAPAASAAPKTDDKPFPSANQIMIIAMEQHPTLKEISEDPAGSAAAFAAVTAILPKTNELVFSLDQSDKQFPLRTNLNLRTHLFMLKPDVMKQTIRELPVEDQMKLAKLIMIECQGKVGPDNPLSFVLSFCIQIISQSDVLSLASTDVLRAFITEERTKEPKNNEHMKQLTDALAAAIYRADKLYAGYDAELLGGRYPFLEADGRVTLFTRKDIADRAVQYYEQNKMGKLTIREISGKEIPAYFELLNEIGAAVIRVDNGDRWAELRTAQVLDLPADNFIEQSNRGLRSLMLREISMGTRIQRLGLQRGTPDFDRMFHWLVMARVNAFSQLGAGLVYVILANGQLTGKDVLCTPAAKARLDELSAANKLALPAPKTELYTGKLTIRVAHRSRQSTALSDSFLFAFTDLDQAQDMIDRMAKSGAQNDLALMVTYDELVSQAANCAGIVFDPDSIGYQIPKTAYPELAKYAAMRGKLIMVNLQNKQPEASKAD